MPLYRVVTHYNNSYSMRAPMEALSVGDARAIAQQDQPFARIVTDAEEMADILDAVWDERKKLDRLLADARATILEHETTISSLSRDLAAVHDRLRRLEGH